MKRRSMSGGLSEPQLEVLKNTRMASKKRKTSIPAVPKPIRSRHTAFHLTRNTQRRIVITFHTPPAMKKSRVSEPTVQLTEKEARALAKQYRHFLGDKNILAISFRCKKVKGVDTATQALVFKVKKKLSIKKISQSKIIPPSVPFRKDSGETQQIITDVVQVAGRLVHQAKSGDAVYVRDGQTTVAGIIPYQIKKEPGEKHVKRLLTSAHLIDFDKSRKGEMLHHPDITQPFCPITGFHPVIKYRRRLKRRQMKDACYNQRDILWADVDKTVKASENIAGIREPNEVKDGDKFEMTGSTSGVLSGTVKATNAAVRGTTRAKDSDGKFYTYWENMIEYEVPAHEGDSGAGLIAQDDKKLIGLHSIGTVSENKDESIETDSSESCESSNGTESSSTSSNCNVNDETTCYACHLYSTED